MWAKTYRDPRNTSEAHKVFAFAPPHILCSLCCLGHLPPTDKLVDFFWIFSNTSICILNMSRKWLPSQLLSLCLADKQGKSVYVTQTKYNSLQIPPCSMCARYHSTNVCHRIPESVCVVAFFHVDALNVEIYIWLYLFKNSRRNSYWNTNLILTWYPGVKKFIQWTMKSWLAADAALVSSSRLNKKNWSWGIYRQHSMNYNEKFSPV